jgi:hypothetical protein
MEKSMTRTPTEQIEEMVKIQSSNGNWNCSPYMMGYANGLILALAVLKNERPKFHSAPEIWLNDIPSENIDPVLNTTESVF